MAVLPLRLLLPLTVDTYSHEAAANSALLLKVMMPPKRGPFDLRLLGLCSSPTPRKSALQLLVYELARYAAVSFIPGFIGAGHN